ncbi:MAG: HAMP domain-containing histidine kinase [Candidatus Lokiarchaeota archaeon]|nr:HAMP domain-containing histidine kinase [Candidatus Lokiarchaeota archaeon]
MKNKNKIFTKTLLINTLWHTLVTLLLFVVFYIITSVFISNIISDNFNQILTDKLKYLIASVELEEDTLIIKPEFENYDPELTSPAKFPQFLQIYSSSSEILYKSKNIPDGTQLPINCPSIEDKFLFEDYEKENLKFRVGYSKIFSSDSNTFAYIQLSCLKTQADIILDRFFILNNLSFLIIFIIILFTSAFLVRKSLKPINKIIDTADKISATNLSDRIALKVSPQDELGRLQNTLNNLFDRLENQIHLMTHFTDNASHQLMTPLTNIKSELNFIFRTELNKDEYKRAINKINEQTERMIALVNTMLLLSKDRNEYKDDSSLFNLTELINNSIRKIYKDENIVYNLSEKIYIRGKQDYFVMVLENIINNAVKYGDKNERIILSVKPINKQVEIRIEDFGIGIPEDEKDKIFTRFYRSSRSEKLGIKGYGLGLSFVEIVIKTMEGIIKVEDNLPKGTKFIIILPRIILE